MSSFPKRPIRVFFSYSHDSSEHKDLVLELCDRLRSNGINAWIDQYEISPPEGWPRWCADQIREADFVLVVCTAVYRRRFLNLEEPTRGRGAVWEGHIITGELYNTGTSNTKFIPVYYPPVNPEYIPDPLRDATYYDLGLAENYWRLYRHLTGQPEKTAPPLGPLVPLPSQNRRTVEEPIPLPPGTRTLDEVELVDRVPDILALEQNGIQAFSAVKLRSPNASIRSEAGGMST